MPRKTADGLYFNRGGVGGRVQWEFEVKKWRGREIKGVLDGCCLSSFIGFEHLTAELHLFVVSVYDCLIVEASFGS